MKEDLRDLVKEKYAELATAAGGGDGGSCCGSSCGCGSGAMWPCGVSDLSRGSYSEAERGELPLLAAEASLGCGNPVALAELSPGEVVLDLGSGGGIDVLLSARRVAPGGKAYGLDMTDEMLELARRNREEAGVENVEFLKGEIEAVPLPDAHVDVVISNCVVNLSTDKPRVDLRGVQGAQAGGPLRRLGRRLPGQQAATSPRRCSRRWVSGPGAWSGRWRRRSTRPC